MGEWPKLSKNHPIPIHSHPFPSIRSSKIRKSFVTLLPGIFLQDFFCNQTAAKQLDPNEMARRKGAVSGLTTTTRDRWIFGTGFFVFPACSMSDVINQHEIAHVQVKFQFRHNLVNSHHNPIKFPLEIHQFYWFEWNVSHFCWEIVWTGLASPCSNTSGTSCPATSRWLELKCHEEWLELKKMLWIIFGNDCF